ncbi:hypothetical protein SiRe_0755 [Sulfolobus islandicus REY15A]|uniref:Uncharacterized protein n=1 Tax=Saccharolobus islandicus (strain REY15A) TaxID=930945 RepID=F0NGN8_SACI5|nr:hypothetical protein SiRe_0755 [Sulfolobus islandicus REY15A]
MGPLPIDVGVPYDHIASAIGAAISSASGVDFIMLSNPS